MSVEYRGRGAGFDPKISVDDRLAKSHQILTNGGEEDEGEDDGVA